MILKTQNFLPQLTRDVPKVCLVFFSDFGPGTGIIYHILDHGFSPAGSLWPLHHWGLGEPQLSPLIEGLGLPLADDCLPVTRLRARWHPHHLSVAAKHTPIFLQIFRSNRTKVALIGSPDFESGERNTIHAKSIGCSGILFLRQQ